MSHAFETVDVFTERRFGGNPLAVFTDARGLLITDAHAPILCSVGNPYIIVEIAPGDLERCAPDLAAFNAAYDGGTDLAERFSVYAYVREGDGIRARMFAPLSGTWEDAATGSAATPLAGLLLHLRGGERIAFDIRQGEYMYRPSLLRAGARRAETGIVATVAGRCVPVFKGETQ